jgi:hypothetical protein
MQSSMRMLKEPLDRYVEQLVRQYAQAVPDGPLARSVSLRDELAIESLGLVSITLRLAGDFGVDVLDFGLELGCLKTFGDLVEVAHTLERRGRGHERRDEAGRRERAGEPGTPEGREGAGR